MPRGGATQRPCLVVLSAAWFFLFAAVSLQPARTARSTALSGTPQQSIATQLTTPLRCGEMPGLVDCAPQYIGFVPCEQNCDNGPEVGERCRIRIKIDTEDPFIRRGVIAWWVFRDIDGRRRYVYDNSFSASLWGDVLEYVLCDHECWTGIEGLLWAYTTGGSYSVIADLEADACVSCKTPTPLPIATTRPPSHCLPWLYFYLPHTSQQRFQRQP